MTRNDPNPTIAVFTAEETCRFTGIGRRRLAAWHRAGFFRPPLVDGRVEGAAYNLYSFRDLVLLRVLAVLREKAGLGTRAIAQAKAIFDGLGDEASSRTVLIVRDGQVSIGTDGAARQGALVLPLADIWAEMAAAVRLARSVRDPALVGHIERRRGVARNKPVIAGTRVLASSIQAFHAAGYSTADILAQYPRLTARDIEAAIAYHAAA